MSPMTQTTSSTSETDAPDLPPPVRWARAAATLRAVFADPSRTDLVLEFTTLANAGQRGERIERFFQHPVGRRLYEEHRAIDSTTVDLDALAALPAGTLGHAYATFMRTHGITPHIFDGPPDDIRDERAAYVMQRMRQTHDLWHVVMNVEPDPAGEIALQAFTYAQVGAPSSGIIAALGSLRALPQSRRVIRDAIELYRIGLRAGRFPVFPFEEHWATPLADVRRMLGVDIDPPKAGGYLVENFGHSLAAA